MRPANDAFWSPVAQQDLIEIWAYYANIASPEIADTMLTDIDAAASLIIENPTGWRERPELIRGIRALPVTPYILFYRIAHKRPEIVRILHGRRNIAKILSGPARQI
jgi:toxin ParE1/3/4